MRFEIFKLLPILIFGWMPILLSADAEPAEACHCKTTMGMVVSRSTSNVPVQNISFGSPITISVGDTVKWTNNDSVPHTVSADGSPALFDNPLPASGGTFSFTFTTAGTVTYHCNIHSSMHGTITVQSNQGAAITSPLTANAVVGVGFSYLLTASGTPTPTVSFSNIPPGFSVNGATLSGTFASPGQVSIGLNAVNSGNTDTKTLVVTVAAATPPAITSPLTGTAVVGTPYTYTLTATGNPPPALSFTNPPAGFQVNGATITGTFSASGQVSIGLNAMSSAGTDAKNLVVTVNAAGTVPFITSPLTATATVGQAFSYTITASGSPTPTFAFTSVPAGFQTTADTISGTFAAAGQVSIGISAMNSQGTDSKTLVVTVSPQTTVPVITSPFAANVLVGAVFNYTLTASGTPTPALTFTAVPAGVQVTGAALSGTFSAPGQFSIGLHASNSNGTDDKTLLVTVGTPPAITSPLSLTTHVGAPISYTLTASGSPAANLTFTNLPPGLQASGGVLTGTLNVAGQFTAALHAFNGFGQDDKTLTIVVQPNAPPPAAPAITSPLSATAIIGADFTYTITATGAAPITFTVDNLPATLALNGPVISGHFDSAGPALLVLTATNAAGSDKENLAVNVSANTEGISGDWSGTFKGKKFDQTGSAKPSVAGNTDVSVTFFQHANDLSAKLSTGGKTFSLQGRIAAGQFWLAGGDDGKSETLTLSGHVGKSKSIKGEGINIDSSSSVEFILALKQK